MKLKHIVSGISLFAAFSFIGCKSAPVEEPKPEPVVEAPVEEPKEEPKVEEPKNDFSENNAKLLERVEAARNKAIEAEASKAYPELFADAEGKYEPLKNSVATDTATDYTVQLADLAAKYNSLANAAEAKRLKARVDELAFNEMDKSVYGAGEAALSKYEEMGVNGTGADLLAQSAIALESYKALMNKGFVALAGRERQAALDAKKQADSVKAGVAQKEIYKNASETFKAADSSYVTKNIEAAYNGYKSSKETYLNLFETISAKRAAAQAAIDRAKARVAEAESYTTEADSIAPLTEEVAGIEKEDAVLLEKDELANPEDAVINVEEGATAQAAEKAAETAIAVEEAANKAVDSIVNEVKNDFSEAK